MNDYLTKLREMRDRARQAGGAERIEQQHQKGKLTARERLALLLDVGSFQELGALATHNITDFGMASQRYPGDGVITGFGKINGRRVAVYAQDFTVLGGSFSQVQSQKICRIQDLALESGIPVIGLNDSGGARIQEGVRSLAAYGELFTRNVMASGVIPQISLILGPCAGGAVYSPALTDFIIMTRQNSYMFITGPEVVKAVTGENVTFEELGGTLVHNGKSGVAHFLAQDERSALELVKLLLSYLPQNNTEDPPQITPYDSRNRMDESLNTVVPPSDDEPYDMRDVVDMVFDEGSFLEVQPYYARNAVVGFARLDGFSVGVVGNQPNYMAGVLDIDSSDKIARFVTLCDAFNIPLVTFVDVPGYMPGTDQEHNGIILSGAKLLYAYCEATVPKLTVTTRKAYGGAYCVMSSKHIRGDLNLAWPTAEFAVMGPEAAVEIIFRRELRNSPDPAARKAELAAEYRQKLANPFVAAEHGFVDDVIEPRDTRARLINGLEVFQNKRDSNPPKKHGNIPL